MISIEKGMPTNIDAERFVLGSILLDDTCYPEVAAGIGSDDFALEKHRRIHRAMEAVRDRGERVDRVTVANELMSRSELESVDGLSYLVSLDDGLPHLPNVGEYVRIVRDKATLRKIITAAHHYANRASLDAELPSEILADASRSFLDLAERGGRSRFMTPAEIIEQGGGINAYVDRRNRTRGIPTGYKALDAMVGGLKPGALYILAARPKMGKTGLAMNIVERVSVDAGHVSLVFSLEMSKEELIDRMICSRARVDTQRFGGGFLNEEERKAVGRAAGEIADGDRILIDDRANITTQDMHAAIRREQAKRPVHLVVVDYLQLLMNCKPSERAAVMSQISRDHKLIAKDCRVPILALSQLSRALETRGSDKDIDGYRPVPSDLRESGSIEQDADVVMSVFRGEVYVKHREELLAQWRGLADLEVLLHRGGPTGIVPLTFLSRSVRFEERAAEAA